MRWGAEVRVLAATLKPAQIRENNKLWAVGTRFATQTFAGGGSRGLLRLAPLALFYSFYL